MGRYSSHVEQRGEQADTGRGLDTLRYWAVGPRA